MKNYYLLAIVAIFSLVGCTTKRPDAKIVAKIEGVEFDSAYVYRSNYGTQIYTVDTVAPNGPYIIVADSIDKPASFKIELKGHPIMEMNELAFSVLSADVPTYTVNATFDKANGMLESFWIDGSNIYNKAFAKLESEVLPLKKECVYITSKIREHKDNIDSLKVYAAKIVAIRADVRLAYVNYIKANTASPLSLNYLLPMHRDTVLKYFPIISQQVKDSVGGEALYSFLESRYNFERSMVEATERVQIGKQYVDFVAKGPNDSDVELGSVLNKNGKTVLYFWGTWCDKGDVKQMATLNSKGAKIVAINCGDTPEDWAAAIAGKNWVNIKNGVGLSDIASIYKLDGYPAHIVLDKTGVITGRYINNDPKFYGEL